VLKSKPLADRLHPFPAKRESQKVPWKRGELIPTNLVVGFLGSGKTTAITKLIEHRPKGEHWSILVNEFGTVSIDHTLLDTDQDEIAVEELGGGCFCCTMSFAFKPRLAQFIRRSKPDRLILEPSGLSHPAKVVDMLRSSDFSGAIDLRNIICLIDPKDFDDPRWQSTEVFQDQVQLADIVVINWTDSREREQIDRCRQWVESLNPPKQLIVETKFGVIAPELLDQRFDTVRFPLFAEAHSVPSAEHAGNLVSDERTGDGPELHHLGNRPGTQKGVEAASQNPAAGNPLRCPNSGPDFQACGWIFHVDDVFNRDKLLDFLSAVRPVVRLKGVFRCESGWWSINRAKTGTDFSASSYRRDSRLEIILDSKSSFDWDRFENDLLKCVGK